MAPTGRRSSIRSRATKISSTVSPPVRHTHARSQSAFSTSKKDKRMIKHSALISRIEKFQSQSKKRRRPSKKLVTNLESLVKALPDAPSRKDEAPTETPIARIRHRSLKSQPGAMKKRDKIIRIEKERFNQNMAQLAAMRRSGADGDGATDGTGAITDPGTGSGWATLRSFIQQTMEVRPNSVMMPPPQEPGS
ncbi:MAG: hypothetical protein Q9181_004459 [Wetmoreana brouardii]